MKRWIVCIVALACLSVVSVTVSGETFTRGAGYPLIERDLEPSPAKIRNRVVDLLSEEIILTSTDDSPQWESEPFDTSQYNRIGLRFSAETMSGPLSCWVCWRYARDESFLDGIPAVRQLVPSVGGQDPGNGSGGSPPDGVSERPDGLPDLFYPRQFYLGSPLVVDFTEVRGLQARVRCSLGLGDFGRIGDDPVVDPDDPASPPVSTEVRAKLTDVKVLLRRE